jgi:hypothetical protein
MAAFLQQQLQHGRGLEIHVSSEQQLQRHFALMFILYATSLDQSTSKVAAVAEQCTAYARALAVDKGFSVLLMLFMTNFRCFLTTITITTINVSVYTMMGETVMNLNYDFEG